MPNLNYGKLSFWLSLFGTLGELINAIPNKEGFIKQVQFKNQAIDQHFGVNGGKSMADDDTMYIEDNTSASEDKNLLDFMFGSGPNDDAVRMQYLDEKGKKQVSNVKFPTKQQRLLDREMDEIASIYIRAFGSARNALYALTIFRDGDMRIELEKRLRENLS